MDKIKIIILIFLLINCGLYGQADDRKDLIIKINQQILPGPAPDIMYELKNTHINIFKIDSSSRLKLIKKKKIYSHKLDISFIKMLKFKIDSLNINNLNDSYSSIWLDGILWKFDIEIDRFKKEIYLDNYFLPEIGLILDLINDKLPKKRRLIRFEYLGIKERFLKENKN